MKNIKYLVIVVTLCGLLQSCLKDTTFLNVGNTTPLVEFSWGSPANGIAASNFGTLTPDSTGAFDTVIAINLASPQVLNTDITVTVIIDTALLNSYNAANATNLTVMPDTVFAGDSQPTLKVVIPAGYRIKKIPIRIYTNKIDPSQSYAIPYTIVSAKAADGSNVIVSGNAGSILYTFIGNPLAGNYSDVGTRYNYTGTINYTGGPEPTPVSTNACPSPKTATPLSSSSIAIDYANLGGSGWQYSFTTIPGVTDSLAVGANFTSSITAGSFTVYNCSYDPINRIIHVVTSYVNSAGNERIVDETLTHQ